MELSAWMEQWNMFPRRGGTILCAVSGGRDSVCLLHYLHSIAGRYGFCVAAGHYNHHMRPTAQRDEDFVRALCAEWHIPFYTAGDDVCRVARQRRRGVEETGRQLRYAFLEELADAIGAQRIATAHHMGDQAETVLLNLLRGTGPEGLSGIPPVRGRLIRPLLNTPRQEIEAYLEANGLCHVEDETNESLDFARNRLRRVVLPELEKLHPALRQNIARTAAIVRREDRYLDQLAAGYLPTDGTEVSCAQLLDAPEALRPRMVRLLMDRLSVGKKDFSALHVEAVLRAAEEGGMVSLPGGAAAIARGGQVKLCVLPPLPETAVLRRGATDWGCYRICLQQKSAGVRQDPHAIYLTCDTMGSVVQVDAVDGGERLTLPGSRGSRSVKRLLAERGVPPEERQQAPCIRVDGVLAAVYGVGTDVKFAPEDNTGAWVEITIEKREHKMGG